jgi:hypothetical protein
MVTGPEHLGFILEDIPLSLELSTCSLYTHVSQLEVIILPDRVVSPGNSLTSLKIGMAHF